MLKYEHTITCMQSSKLQNKILLNYFIPKYTIHMYIKFVRAVTNHSITYVSNISLTTSLSFS